MDDKNPPGSSSNKKANNISVNIQIPDIISNASANSKNYSKLENDEESENGLATRPKSNPIHSVQMQQEVKIIIADAT